MTIGKQAATPEGETTGTRNLSTTFSDLARERQLGLKTLKHSSTLPDNGLKKLQRGDGAPLFRQAKESHRRERARRLRSAFDRDSQKHLEAACDGLYHWREDLSARRTFTHGQAVFLALALIVTCAGLIYTAKAMIFWMLGGVSVFYLAAILMRIGLLAKYEGISPQPALRELKFRGRAGLPTYSVLVALYREENQVRALTQALSKLDWPKDRLEIKLICEADDHATIKAIQHLNLPAYFELVVVPRAEPKTKPKALNYALPLCTGDYVVLYDAEDRPDPGQLLEAWATFSEGGERLACLQAPLMIHNHRQSFLTRQFALEYATLFHGLLPVIAKLGIPVPLGGTSNHFRRSILISVGGWDPYNVTEDADLGVRLYRFGYRSDTISRPTLEEAPPRFDPWLKQRTRWLKGWLQTILVHSRHPVRFFREVGVLPTIGFHLIMTSLIISSLFHPVLFGLTAYMWLTGSIAMEGMGLVVAFLSVFVLTAGYACYIVLAWSIHKDLKRRQTLKHILLVPVYWILISVAGWRAVWQLFTAPHFWEKTPHGLSRPESPKTTVEPFHQTKNTA